MQAAGWALSSLQATQPAGKALAPTCFRGLLGQRPRPAPLHHPALTPTHRVPAAPGAAAAAVELGLSGEGAASGRGAAPQVVLTREKGKNSKLQKALEARGITCLEMPLIETLAGPDREVLPEVLRSQRFDWVVITSPEAASVFLAGWRAAGRPDVRVAVVGQGTGVVLDKAEGDALRPQFVPSAADAVHFSAELPHIEGGTNAVLYPASNKAASTLQEGLAARGFAVHRLNTYDTVPVTSVEAEVLEQAKRALVVTAASPSTIKSWVKLVGDQSVVDVAVACIGSTSARAAERLGLGRIYYPEDPGMEGFITSIEQALADCGKLQS